MNILQKKTKIEHYEWKKTKQNSPSCLVCDHGGQVALVVHVGHQGPGVGGGVVALDTPEPPGVVIVATSHIQQTIELGHRGSLSPDLHLR